MSWNYDERQFEETLAELKEVRAWEKVPSDRPYGSLSALLEAEIGEPERAIEQKISETKLRRHGRPLKAEGQNKGSNRTFKRGEGDREYLTARITRDRPDILERMKAGEFKSVRAAALEAGIVKKRLSIPSDVIGAAAAIRRHFTPAEVAEIIERLKE